MWKNFKKDNDNKWKYLSALRSTHESYEIFFLYSSIQLPGSVNDIIALQSFDQNCIEMSNNPPYMLRIVMYLYKNYYKICQTNMRFNIRNKNIFLQEDRDSCWTAFMLPLLFWYCWPLWFDFSLLCCFSIWSFTLESSFTFGFYLILFDTDTLWLCWSVFIFLPRRFTFTVH